jgi:type IV secretion system protein VirB3
MQDSAQDVQTDVLFVGLTRPATVAGIPYVAFVVEVMAVALVFLAVGHPFCLALAVPVHAALYLISANDPGAFDAIYMWLKTFGRCRNARAWGAASFSPLSYGKRHRKGPL